MRIETDDFKPIIKSWIGRWKHIPPDEIIDLCLGAIEIAEANEDARLLEFHCKSKLKEITNDA